MDIKYSKKWMLIHIKSVPVKFAGGNVSGGFGDPKIKYIASIWGINMDIKIVKHKLSTSNFKEVHVLNYDTEL